MASLSGCGIPEMETLLGPFRVWEYPKYFRSRRVKNAMPARAMINDRVMEMANDIIVVGKVLQDED